MNKAPGLIILLHNDQPSVENLSHTLQSLGREIAAVDNYDAIAEHCDDPLIQPVVVCSENAAIETAGQRQQLQTLAASHLVIIAMSKQCTDSEEGIDQVAEYFRLGVADVVFPGASEAKIKNTLQQVDQRAESRVQKRLYRTELEKANMELQESLRLLKQDQLAGLEVQKSLMPESPLKFGDYEISHSITPSLYLSGDFVGYNFVLGRYLLFYFADVSGHGASSAFITVLLRFMIGRVIRRHQLEKDYVALAQAPEGLLEHINNQLLATGLGKHLTMVAGSLDTETSKLRYVVGAQQPSPILVTEGKAEYLPGKGKPAGIFEDAAWGVEEITVPEKFAFVLLSDGVFELVPDKEIEDKEQTLLSYLASSSENIDKLRESLAVDNIEDPQDDISVLLLTRGM